MPFLSLTLEILTASRGFIMASKAAVFSIRIPSRNIFFKRASPDRYPSKQDQLSQLRVKKRNELTEELLTKFPQAVAPDDNRKQRQKAISGTS
ncbi:hypothetical protein JTB14_013055 [Gonioctena quinquepunctata]|nr:hypothetical protein JTB14_013055 [Gonioctena quinquepunctata]